MAEDAFDIRDDGPLPGLSDFIPERADVSDVEIEQIAAAIDNAALPLQMTMGPREVWARFVRSFSRRKLVRELPVEERMLTWFEGHAPPGGTAVIRIGSSALSEGAFSMDVFGSGFGTGRSITLTETNESGPRPGCVSYAVKLSVRPRVYSKGEGESIEISVIGVTGKLTVTRPRSDCAWCSALDRRASRFEFLADAADIDLSRDSVATTVTHGVDLELQARIEAGLTIPAIAAPLRLTASLKRGATIQVECQLPPGRVYRPFSYLPAEGAPHSRLWTAEKSMA